MGVSANTVLIAGQQIPDFERSYYVVTRYSRVLHGSTNGQLKKMERSIMKLRGL
jgi:hypothetical protein